MGDRCSFFHTALIELILRKVFLGISSINAMWKNEHLSPIPKQFSTELSAQSVKFIGFQPFEYFSLSGKALNGIQWKVAHPLAFNYGAPIASMDTTC